MKVLLDASHLGFLDRDAKYQSGIWRVTRGLIDALEAHPEVEIHFGAHNSFVGELQLAGYLQRWSPQLLPRLANLWKSPRKVADADPMAREIADAVERGDLARARVLQTELNAMMKRPVPEPFDVMHTLFLGLPANDHVVARARVLTAHDLIPALFPEWCNDDPQVFREGRLADFDPLRDFAVAPSASARADLCKVTGVEPERVFVVPWAIDHGLFRPAAEPADQDSMLSGLGLTRDGYLLAVGTLEPRKNLARLLRCFYRCCRQGSLGELKLVLVGAKGWKYDPIFAALREDARMMDRVVVTGYVEDEMLPALYSGAVALLFPSLYEGFGMPPLEAMACGTPVVTSNTSSLPEVVGDVGLLVDPRDDEALAAAMVEIADDTALRTRLRARGIEQAARYEWGATAEGYVDMYRRVLADS